MKPKTHTIPYDFLIKLVSLAKGLVFHSIEENFPENEELEAPYPSALLCNHVSEADVVSLSMVYPRLNPKIKMIIPAREDILKRGFLQKEFRAKGFLKWILKFIDATNIIPILLRYIGAVPIKRPFRDNARELIKKGELRDKVDSEWTDLVAHIRKGRNLFMFPEGTYNHDGFLNQVKRGAYYIKSKIDKLHFNSFTLTYDHLSYKKTKLYIKYGKPFEIPNDMPADQVVKLVAETLGKHYTVTLGNLTSFVLLKLGTETKIKKQQLVQLLSQFKLHLEKQFPEITIASELRKENFQSQLELIFSKLKKVNFIDWEDEVIKTKEILYHIPKSLHNLKKSNIVLYHKNQLTAHLTKLEQIWNQLAMETGVKT
ncbi:1-acyl-sn-glycerol-3-phosphate acyltransferase [Leptospira biflexa]|nr:lysophospholipid acyltransferase family protein [Leptospira biflexa]TGM31700.1 1-acyl-sn-glycerol-3-phosphate acyltransferase [Leptospira biflexa]TGM39141.1 1-acyl-sn-glycerol-3-phosphate acyltransferase [Leptospira biflexa]TGM44553.1 1-acyl-sn-glycerol-3-phosphate acyltransferase [Leptospira biflexa]TGM45406.1 1-acyl-sn-glycerol-3-phosphate acyltransferase [Leptospira biflexa]TGM53960.1 1-acyl-sn-glycerol-3-phosphate acyltransferase [Leptospira biflexa]